MPTLDIFNNDAFGVSTLSQTITDIPRVPTLIGDSGLFNESGISTTTMMIERQGGKLNLVPTAPRGGVGQGVSLTGRKMIPVMAVHLPQTATVLADEVQNIRAFGSETEVQAVSSIVTKKLGVMRGNLDLTLEYHRVGAIKGLILDADGSQLLDLYVLFGMTQTVMPFNVATPTASGDVKASCVALKRVIKRALGGRSFTGVTVLCSETFFDAVIAHASVAKAYAIWQQGAFFQNSQVDQGDFQFAGVTFRIYSGGTDGGGDFIPAGEAYAYPTGLPSMFQTAFAPADYMETVNTNGLPFYAKQMLMDFDKGIAMESQSNPINLNTLPEATIKLKAGAS